MKHDHLSFNLHIGFKRILFYNSLTPKKNTLTFVLSTENHNCEIDINE